jgi:hypothetical protein
MFNTVSVPRGALEDQAFSFTFTIILLTSSLFSSLSQRHAYMHLDAPIRLLHNVT